ncbi:MAG: DUF4900 domain-containing protein [Candidatus Eisenbacteria bacterium]
MRIVRAGSESGIALVIAIAVTMVISAMALAIATLSITEKGIPVNQKVAAQALFNADAAVEVAKQQMATFSQAKMETLRTVWPGVGAIITNPLSFFPAGGLTFNSNQHEFEVVTTFEFADSTLLATSQTFNFRYRSLAKGTSYISGEKHVVAEGNLRLSASRGSFSDFLLFTDTHYTPSGSPIWFHTSGYFDGRIHSNDKLRFAYFPTFEDLVTCVPQKASYYNNGKPKDLDADRNGNIDVPNFYGGFERGADRVDLPSNSFSQERAALGYAAVDTTQLSTGEIKQALGLDPAAPGAVPNGLYVPNDSVSVTGGIYIVGDARDVTLSINHYGFQDYEVTDENGVTSHVVLDRTNLVTKIYSGGDSTIYAGLPRGMVYVTGGISSIGGKARVAGTPPPALEEHTQVTITAKDDILIDRDIVYEDFVSTDCVLGVYSAGGDIRITTAAPDELMLDAYILAAGSRGAFTVDNYNRGSYRGQVHLRGGVVEKYYGPFGTFGQNGAQTGYGRDFRYDRRGISPPYYPLTNVFKVDKPVPHTTSWREA